MSSSFSTQVLSEKLTKLNNSQQSIETLSNWCIFHRKKARQVVETWEKLFNSSQKDKRVSFLYLANDILQNSRRKGSEFVNEFWKVLPGTLRSVSEDGDENGKNVVTRLVDIWEQRKVFGSRGKSLKEEMSSKDSPPLLENNGVSSHSVKVGRKDAHTIRIKLIVGSMPEKIVTAFQSVHDEHFNEDTALNKCKTAVRRVAKMEKDVDDTCAQGNQGSQLVDELEEQETVLKQSIEQLKGVEATRSALVDLLKEAIQEQESKMELLRNQLQVAENESEHASKMKQRLTSSAAPTIESMASTIPTETLSTLEPNPSPLQTPITTPCPPLPPQPINSFINSLTTTDDQQNKAAAAAIAAKLAASTSSAQMLSSVLSSLAAEEAASASITKTSGFTMSSPMYPLEKRPKLEKPYFGSMQLGTIPLAPPQATNTNSQPMMNQSNFTPPLPPLPPPPPVQQFTQTSRGVIMVPFTFGGSAPPPPTPMQSNMFMSLARPATPPPPPQQQQQQQQPQPQQQQSVSTGFYQSPGIGFFGQSHHPPTPPVPRQ